MRKLVFRTKSRIGGTALPSGFSFRVADSLFSALALAPALVATYGLKAAAKTVAKAITPSRAYYALVKDGKVHSDGWIMFGHCESYEIGSDNHVIGPINTIEVHRGQGLAHLALVRGVDYCLDHKANWVYIDTTEANTASQRAILKSGFELYKTIEI